MSLTVDMEAWELLAKQFEDVVAITTLLNISVNEKAGDTTFQPISVSVSQLLNGGRGKYVQNRI